MAIAGGFNLADMSSLACFRLPVVALSLACALTGALAEGCEAPSRPLHELYGDDSGLGKLSIAKLVALASAKNAPARNELGVRYGTGVGVALDSKKSVAWYRLAADQGLAVAQVNVAAMYLNGEGVARDPAMAAEWAAKAAAQGHNRGLGLLGAMYRAGLGVDQNGPAAERCFLLASNQGDLTAQRTLMNMYEKGDVIPADPAKAVLWLHRIRDGTLFGTPWRDATPVPPLAAVAPADPQSITAEWAGLRLRFTRDDWKDRGVFPSPDKRTTIYSYTSASREAVLSIAITRDPGCDSVAACVKEANRRLPAVNGLKSYDRGDFTITQFTAGGQGTAAEPNAHFIAVQLVDQVEVRLHLSGPLRASRGEDEFFGFLAGVSIDH